MQPSSHGTHISGMNGLGERYIIKLAQRMTELFYSEICSSSRRKWETLSSGNSCVRLMLCKNIDSPLKLVGMFLSATASIWLPVKQETLFNFLSNHCNRNERDSLSSGMPMQEILSITKAPGHKNRVSVLCANGGGSSQASMVLLQEAWIDASGSLIVYVPVNVLAINGVMMGGDFGEPSFLPSGFATYPVGPSSSLPSIDGSFLTIGFQILVSTNRDAKLTAKLVEAVHGLISCITRKIKAAMHLP